MTPLELVGVRVEIPANTPMMLLQEQEGDRRLLPVFIGPNEASAIHFALEGLVPPRPLTHDLLLNTIEQFGGSLEKVVITEVVDHTYLAELYIATAGGEKVLSSRPSDAVALAVRCSAQIFASDELLDEVGQIPVPEPEDEAEEIIDEFKDFIEHVSPEDFAS